MGYKITVQDLLDDPYLLEDVQKFLFQESMASLLFVIEVEKFQKLVQMDELTRKAVQIYHQFVQDPLGERIIQLSTKTLTQLTSLLKPFLIQTPKYSTIFEEKEKETCQKRTCYRETFSRMRISSSIFDDAKEGTLFFIFSSLNKKKFFF